MYSFFALILSSFCNALSAFNNNLWHLVNFPLLPFLFFSISLLVFIFSWSICFFSCIIVFIIPSFFSFFFCSKTCARSFKLFSRSCSFSSNFSELSFSSSCFSLSISIFSSPTSLFSSFLPLSSPLPAFFSPANLKSGWM